MNYATPAHEAFVTNLATAIITELGYGLGALLPAVDSGYNGVAIRTDILGAAKPLRLLVISKRATTTIEFWIMVGEYAWGPHLTVDLADPDSIERLTEFCRQQIVGSANTPVRSQ